MFGKMMNSYFYGKSGKGDYRKEDLPTNRWQLFWEMLRVRLSGLMRLNLIYVLPWLPTMLVLTMGVISMLTVGISTEDLASAAAGTDAAAIVTTETAAVEEEMLVLTDQEYADLVRGTIQLMLMLLIPCIAITGPFSAGISYVTRNWARDEHAFIWSDFKDAVKENWKQSLPISIITGLMPMMVYMCWQFYGTMAVTQTFMVVPQTLTVMIGLVWALSVTYMYPLIVSYKMRMRDVFRNGLLLAIARLPMSAGIRLLHCVPALIAFVAALFFNPIWAVLGLFAYYLLFGFGLSRFITASYTNAVFDKYINSRIEGAVVNRGLNPDPDVDDYDEDEDEKPSVSSYEEASIADIVEQRRRESQNNQE